MENQIIDLENVDFTKKKEEMSIPLSYIPIAMSTNGHLGVPEQVHCRNFSTSDLLTLSMVSNSIMPEKIVSVLNSIIYEKVDIADWPDKSIIELLVKLYVNFFTPSLPQVVFPWDETDIEYLKQNKDEDKVESLQKGIWVPRIDLDLRAIDIIPLKSNIKDKIHIRPKDTKGKVVGDIVFLSYPRYGDTLILKKLLSDKFDEEGKKYQQIETLVNTYSDYINDNKDTSQLSPIDPIEYMNWQEYMLQKNVFATNATLAYYIQEVNGEDVSSLNILDKIELLKNPLFDNKVFKTLNSHFGKIEFGLNPEIKVYNPITGKPCIRRFQFRLHDIIQALQSLNTDEYDISYD